MSLEQTDKVDAMGLDQRTGHIVLTVADAWNWNDEIPHLLALQEKINAYFKFIETGQVWESCESDPAKILRVNVVFRYPPPASALEFLEKAASAAVQLQVLVSYEVFSGIGDGA